MFGLQQNNSLGDDGVSAIGEGLKVNNSLQWLGLVSCRVLVFIYVLRLMRHAVRLTLFVLPQHIWRLVSCREG